MVASAFTAPHVTELLTVDVTRTMELRRAAAGAAASCAASRSSRCCWWPRPLLLAVAAAPDDQLDLGRGGDQEIVVKDYVNLGIAAATPRGLVVPNIKDADRLSLLELADALTDAGRDRARRARRRPADMAGGTFTITNVGVFGVDTGTPIINPGEAAILAFGAVREQPWVHKGKIKVRAGDHARRCPSTTGSSTASWARGSSPTWARSSADPEACLLAWT